MLRMFYNFLWYELVLPERNQIISQIWGNIKLLNKQFSLVKYDKVIILS